MKDTFRRLGRAKVEYAAAGKRHARFEAYRLCLQAVLTGDLNPAAQQSPAVLRCAILSVGGAANSFRRSTAQLRPGRSQRVRSKPIGFGASTLMVCCAAHPEPNAKDRTKRNAMEVTNRKMVIVERSSSRVSRSGPRRILMRIVFGLALALTLVSARAEPLPRTILFLDEDTPIYPWFRQMSEAFYATIKTETANPPF